MPERLAGNSIVEADVLIKIFEQINELKIFNLSKIVGCNECGFTIICYSPLMFYTFMPLKAAISNIQSHHTIPPVSVLPSQG